jgi:uncharacterized membrane protein YciS (DUF1049 family)
MITTLEYILAHGGELIGLICGVIFSVSFIIWLVRHIFWN